jgi:hypothetical protein
VNPRRPRPSGFPTARGDRSHRGRRPKPPDSVRVPSPPAEAGGELASAEAFAGASLDRSSRHPPKWAASRPEKRAPRALPSTFRRRPKPSVAAACRSGRRAVGNLPARAACRSRHRAGWSGCAPPAEAESGGPAWDGVSRQPKLSGHRDRCAGSAEAGSVGTGRCRRGRASRRPASQAEAGSVPPRWARSRRTLSWVCWMLRSAEADPHIHQEGQDARGAVGRCRSTCLRLPSGAGVLGTLPENPFPGPRGQMPSGGAADFEALLR